MLILCAHPPRQIEQRAEASASPSILLRMSRMIRPSLVRRPRLRADGCRRKNNRVLPSNCLRSDGALDNVGIDFDPPIAQEAFESGPPGDGVA